MPISSVGLPSYETPRQSFSLLPGAPMLSSTAKVSGESKQTPSQASNSRAPIEVDPWVSGLARSAETSTGASPSVASASPTGTHHERSGDKSQELSAPGPPAMSTHHQHTLTGLVISPSYYLTDLQGSKGVFFIFSEMGVRVAGKFRLRISLVDLRSTIAASGPSPNTSEPSRDSATELTSVVTDVFEVYGVRDFPGQKESPELVRHFAEQGVRVGVRRRGSTK
ncbi:hypothetical protein HDU85_003712 [Gaertneriomyces sp. JEL0708]|nr:hypothetical protein HDU85_003712 [Gaertneriomyces sp. JEL0708]